MVPPEPDSPTEVTPAADDTVPVFPYDSGCREIRSNEYGEIPLGAVRRARRSEALWRRGAK
jgi:hypothetical protein